MTEAATNIAAVTALAVAIGAIVKQVLDIKQIKRWICTRNPCENRVISEPPPE